MLLPLSDIRQTNDHDCGEAAVKTVLAFHGISGVVRFSTPTDGADPRVIENALRRIGLRVTSGEMTPPDLRHYCDHRRPVICLVHWDGDDSSHWLVVRGISRGQVYYHDVSSGPGRCNLGAWNRAWRADGRFGEPWRAWGVVAYPG